MSIESNGMEPSKVWWRSDPRRHQGGHVAAKLRWTFWVVSTPKQPCRQVSRFGPHNQGHVQCDRMSETDDTWCHREAYVEAKLSREGGVSVRYFYKKARSFCPCVDVCRSFLKTNRQEFCRSCINKEEWEQCKRPKPKREKKDESYSNLQAINHSDI